MAELLAHEEGTRGTLQRPAGPAAGTLVRDAVVAVAPAACFGLAVAVAMLLAADRSWGRSAASGACAALLYLLAQAVDRVPALNRAARSGLAPSVDLRASVALALVLVVAHELAVFPVGALGIAVALAAAAAAGLLAVRLGRPTRVLVVGTGPAAARLARALAARGGAIVLGVVDDSSGPVDLARRSRADAVVLDCPPEPERELADAVRALGRSGVAVALVPRLAGAVDGRVAVRTVGGVPLLVVDPSFVDRRLPAVERALDVLLAAVLLVLLVPVYLLIALAILVESPGPVLYRAERVGRGGKTFRMLKFRKMRPDAESGSSAVTKAGDERFTRVGRFLHEWKLDELPQFWNVIRGEMALVGPRPEDPRYVALYPEGYAPLLEARPGVTGVAALKYRDETDLLGGTNSEELYRDTLLPDKIALERDFADRRSIGLSLRVLLWTPLALARLVDVGWAPETGRIWFRWSRRGRR